MQDTSSSSSAFDEHDCAGRLASAMRLLAPELRVFIESCVTKYLETAATQAQLASTATTTTTTAKKKKKAKAKASKQAFEQATTIVTANVHGSVDFAADLKFVEQHWGLYFEPRVGIYASELRAAVVAAAVCRNKIAHQVSITAAEWTDWCDALSALAVFVCASVEVKQKLRALMVVEQHVSPGEFVKRIRELQDALEALENAQIQSFEDIRQDINDDVKVALFNQALKDEQMHKARANQAASDLKHVHTSLWRHASIDRLEELHDEHKSLTKQLQAKVNGLPFDVFDRFEREAARKKRQEQLERDQGSCHWLWMVALLILVLAVAASQVPPPLTAPEVKQRP